MLTTAQAWDILARVPDPEIPAISVTELGIVRDVQAVEEGVDVVVTPTYSGCPATEVIERSIREALSAAGARDVRVRQQLSPAWSTDWIAEDARERLPSGRWAACSPCPSCRAWPARAAAAPTPSACRSSDPPHARRCTAAAPAVSPSNTSNPSR